MDKVAVGRVAAAVLAMCLVFVPCTLCAQGVGGIAPNAFPRQVVAAKLPAANGTQGVRIVTNALSDSDCTVGGGNTKLICFDNGVWTVIGVGGGGGGSDDQTASEVPITDTGDFYSGSEVESALQQVGGDARWTDARTPLLHTHTSAGITDFASAVQGIGDARYTLLGHTHTSSSVTDFTTATQAVGDVRYSILGHVHTSSSVTDFTTSVQSVGDARYSLLAHLHNLQDLPGAVTDLQVPNTVTISGTPERCARYDVSGNLVPSSGDCVSGDTGITNPLLSALQVIAGTSSVPGLNWGGDAGFYEISDNRVGLALPGNSVIMDANTNRISVGERIDINVDGVGNGATITSNASSTFPSIYPNWNDSDTGVGWGGANDLRGVAGGVSALGWTDTKVTTYVKAVNAAQALTIADNGNGGTRATSTLTPTTSYVSATCNDGNGCDITLSETGAVDGQILRIVCGTANLCGFADTAGVTELAGAVDLGQYDSLSLLYATDRWIETARSDN